MRYAQLRAFHHVALHGGFSRAAEALALSQPSLSDQVRRLEQAHDVLLFHRGKRQIRLTDAGKDLFRLTQAYFETEAQIETQLSSARRALQGTLRIKADSAVHVTAAIARFRAQHPQARLQVTTGNSDTVLAALRNYEADIGVLGHLPGAPDLECLPLGTTPIVAVAAPGFLPRPAKALSLAELAQYPLIFRETGSRTRAALDEAAGQAGLSLAPAIEAEGREAMRELVAAGLGIGFISQAELGRDTRLEHVALADADLQMPEALVHLSQRRDVPLIRAFRRALPDAERAP